MDFGNIVLLFVIAIGFVICILTAIKKSKEEIEKREIIETILRRNTEYEKINEKLKKEIKKLKNETKKQLWQSNIFTL